MKYILDEDDQFLDGKCVFCGEDAEQKNWPGDGWNKYDHCECPESKAYYEKYDECTRELRHLCTVATARRKIMELEKEDRVFNAEIKKIKEKKRDILWEAERKMKVIEGANANENDIRRKRRNLSL